MVLIDTPPSVNMEALIQYAHVNLLMTFQQTGIKLKLLHALESGKHILINSLMDDSGIFKSMCHVKDKPNEIIQKINDLMLLDFTDHEDLKRKELFSRYFDNEKNAEAILKIISE